MISIHLSASISVVESHSEVRCACPDHISIIGNLNLSTTEAGREGSEISHHGQISIRMRKIQPSDALVVRNARECGVYHALSSNIVVAYDQ